MWSGIIQAGTQSTKADCMITRSRKLNSADVSGNKNVIVLRQCGRTVFSRQEHHQPVGKLFLPAAQR
jgi:hypothetical protein